MRKVSQKAFTSKQWFDHSSVIGIAPLNIAGRFSYSLLVSTDLFEYFQIQNWLKQVGLDAFYLGMVSANFQEGFVIQDYLAQVVLKVSRFRISASKLF